MKSVRNMRLVVWHGEEDEFQVKISDQTFRALDSFALLSYPVLIYHTEQLENIFSFMSVKQKMAHSMSKSLVRSIFDNDLIERFGEYEGRIRKGRRGHAAFLYHGDFLEMVKIIHMQTLSKPMDGDLFVIARDICFRKHSFTILLGGTSGCGKCLQRDTLVVMETGKVVPAWSLQIGDRLVGPDGHPRTIQSLTHGNATLYHIHTKPYAHKVTGNHRIPIVLQPHIYLVFSEDACVVIVQSYDIEGHACKVDRKIRSFDNYSTCMEYYYHMLALHSHLLYCTIPAAYLYDMICNYPPLLQDMRMLQWTPKGITFIPFTVTIGEEDAYIGFTLQYSEVREDAMRIHEGLCMLSGGVVSHNSTLASLLATRLGLVHSISTDHVRHMLRSIQSKSAYPELFVSTYNAGELLYGSTDRKSVYDGYKKQSDLLYERIDRIIGAHHARGESLIIEGVHLYPELIMKLMAKHTTILPFIIFISNERKHHERFAIRSKYMTLDSHANVYTRYFQSIRYISEEIVKGSEPYMIPCVDNTNIDRSLVTIQHTILSTVQRYANRTPTETADQANLVMSGFNTARYTLWSSKAALHSIQQNDEWDKSTERDSKQNSVDFSSSLDQFFSEGGSLGS